MSDVLKAPLSLAIVDDSDFYRGYLVAALSQRGNFKLHESASGDGLEKILDEHAVDCILLDLNLGLETGTSVAEHLAQRYGALPPILMLTGDATHAFVVKALRLGFKDYFAKRDLDLDELVTAIQSAVEQSREEAALRALATVDGLTGLPNRGTFDQTLNRECRRAQRDNTSVSLLMVDVDEFKALNDALGHQAGDDCLRRLAEVLRAVMLRPADFAGRYGGEEFAIILPDTLLVGGAAVAQRLVASMKDLALPHPSSGLGYVTVSIGVACNEHLAPSPQALIARADAALYRAKRAGRNRVDVHLGPERNERSA
jgi:diguanylate cyclase (GGDEF)-like protein